MSILFSFLFIQFFIYFVVIYFIVRRPHPHFTESLASGLGKERDCSQSIRTYGLGR